MVESGELPPAEKSGKWRWSSVDAALKRNPEEEGWIYFVGIPGFIKIGFAKDLRSRLMQLQISLPFELVVHQKMRGRRYIERGLHYKFHHLHERGEWFRTDPELLNYIKSISGC
jgi:hypothetical protein